jgi:hypothetical protein
VRSDAGAALSVHSRTESGVCVEPRTPTANAVLRSPALSATPGIASGSVVVFATRAATVAVSGAVSR